MLLNKLSIKQPISGVLSLLVISLLAALCISACSCDHTPIA